jgi:hypothetical protein
MLKRPQSAQILFPSPISNIQIDDLDAYNNYLP